MWPHVGCVLFRHSHGRLLTLEQGVQAVFSAVSLSDKNSAQTTPHPDESVHPRYLLYRRVSFWSRFFELSQRDGTMALRTPQFKTPQYNIYAMIQVVR